MAAVTALGKDLATLGDDQGLQLLQALGLREHGGQPGIGDCQGAEKEQHRQAECAARAGARWGQEAQGK